MSKKIILLILIVYTAAAFTQWKDVSVKISKSSINSICKFYAVGDYGLIFQIGHHNHMGYQKTMQNSNVAVNLNSVISFNYDSAWAVGDSGTIIKITNVYGPWTKLDRITNENLNCVYFDSSKSNGWIVGNGGTILKSTNSGTSWQKIDFVRGVKLKSVFFIDSLTGLIVGENGLILKTYNAGQNWKVLKSGTTNHLNSVCFFSASVGYIVGDNGTVFVTKDCGENWESINNISSVNFNSVYCCEYAIDYPGKRKASCYIAGDLGQLFESSDTGKTWTKNIMFGSQKENPSDFNIKSVYAVKFPDAITFDRVIYSVGSNSYIYVGNVSQIQDEISGCFFTSKLDGWATGNSLNKGYILKTTDGGINWTENFVTAGGLKGLCFTSKNNGWAVGNGGLILKTTNAGISWIGEKYSEDDLNSISFCDSLNGRIVGDKTGNLCTTDGGKNWTVSKMISGYENYSLVHVNSPSEAYILGYRSDQIMTAILEYPFILLTSDGGKNWEKLYPSSYGKPFSAYFPTLKKGFVTGFNDYYRKPFLVRFSNTAPSKWLLQTDTLINKVFYANHFYDRLNGFCVGEGGISAKTTDGGESWTYIPTGCDKDLKSVFFFDENNGWATGQNGLILKYDGLTSVTKNNNTVSDFSLSQNYPNPFNPSTTIRYQIPSAGNVKLKIYNSLGQQVRCLVDAVKPAGQNSVEFNASGLPSGAYFYRIESGSYSETKKMLLIK